MTKGKKIFYNCAFFGKSDLHYISRLTENSYESFQIMDIATFAFMGLLFMELAGIIS